MNDASSIDSLLAECDREPIQFPGAVQPHGAMLVVDAATGRVTHASANLERFIGCGGAEAIGQPLATLLGDDTATLVRSAAHVRKNNPSATGIDAGLAGARIRLLPFISTGEAICIDILREPPTTWPSLR